MQKFAGGFRISFVTFLFPSDQIANEGYIQILFIKCIYNQIKANSMFAKKIDYRQPVPSRHSIFLITFYSVRILVWMSMFLQE